MSPLPVTPFAGNAQVETRGVGLAAAAAAAAAAASAAAASAATCESLLPASPDMGEEDVSPAWTTTSLTDGGSSSSPTTSNSTSRPSSVVVADSQGFIESTPGSVTACASGRAGRQPISWTCAPYDSKVTTPSAQVQEDDEDVGEEEEEDVESTRLLVASYECTNPSELTVSAVNPSAKFLDFDHQHDTPFTGYSAMVEECKAATRRFAQLRSYKVATTALAEGDLTGGMPPKYAHLRMRLVRSQRRFLASVIPTGHWSDYVFILEAAALYMDETAATLYQRRCLNSYTFEGLALASVNVACKMFLSWFPGSKPVLKFLRTVHEDDYTMTEYLVLRTVHTLIHPTASAVLWRFYTAYGVLCSVGERYFVHDITEASHASIAKHLHEDCMMICSHLLPTTVVVGADAVELAVAVLLSARCYKEFENIIPRALHGLPLLMKPSLRQLVKRVWDEYISLMRRLHNQVRISISPEDALVLHVQMMSGGMVPTERERRDGKVCATATVAP